MSIHNTWFATATLLLAIAGQANADFVYSTLDFPGATRTWAVAVSGNNVVGRYQVGTGAMHAFLYDGSIYKALNPAGFTEADACDVSGNNVVGDYYDGSDVHGFLYDGSSYTTVDVPGATKTWATAVCGNTVVGHYDDINGQSHVFFYDGVTYDTLDFPSPMSLVPVPLDVSGNNIVGYYDPRLHHGFLYDGSNCIEMNPPDSRQTESHGVSGNSVVGWYYDYAGYQHGFLYDGTTYTKLDVPGAGNTTASDVSGDNVVGSCATKNGDNWVFHGFLYDGVSYTAIEFPGAKTTMAESISGNVVVGTYTDHSGLPHAFKCVIPEPSTLALVGMGAVGLLCCTRRNSRHRCGTPASLDSRSEGEQNPQE